MKYKTGNKEQILDFLKQNSSLSYSIPEICIGTCGSEQGKSTVYRVISELTAEGKIKKISDAKSRHSTYQYMGGGECMSHLHLKCRICGRLIHLDRELSHMLCEKLSELNFSPEAGGMIFGSCNTCKSGGLTDK